MLYASHPTIDAQGNCPQSKNCSLQSRSIKRTDSRWLNVYPPKFSNRLYTRQFEKAPLVRQKKTSKVSINPPWTIARCPKENTSNVYCRQKQGYIFAYRVAMSRHCFNIFHQAVRLIEFLVVCPLLSTILFRRNNRRHPLSLCLIRNCIGIISLVRQQALRCKTINQSSFLLQSAPCAAIALSGIPCGSRSNAVLC